MSSYSVVDSGDFAPGFLAHVAGLVGVWGTPGLRHAGVPGGLRCFVGDFCSSLFGVAGGVGVRWVLVLRGRIEL